MKATWGYQFGAEGLKLKSNLNRIESGSDGFDSKGRIKLKSNLNRIEREITEEPL